MITDSKARRSDLQLETANREHWCTETAQGATQNRPVASNCLRWNGETTSKLLWIFFNQHSGKW